MTINDENSGLTHKAYIAVGSNLGDRIENCGQGVSLLCANGDIKIMDHSRYYHSAPMGYTDQPWFVNAAFSVITSLAPMALLKRLKETEAIAGRSRNGIRFGPRCLDLDLIFFNNSIIDTKKLTVPHPRMHLRAFVLCPLHDIAPDHVHPKLQATIKELLEMEALNDQKCIPIETGPIQKTGVV